VVQRALRGGARPKNEVVALIGSKEGIAHLPFALLDPGDEVLVPDPGYPVYTQASILADAIPKPFPLTWEYGFLPKMEVLEAAAGPKTRLIYLNYPNNPTAARAPLGFSRRWLPGPRSKGSLSPTMPPTARFSWIPQPIAFCRHTAPKR